MSLRTSARFARRELRGGLAGFRIFLACLALGVAAIAGVGSVRSAIEAGLAEQGAVLLGGDAEARLTYRFASPEERAWMESISTGVSEIADFRSMVVVDRDGQVERGLTQVKAVDDAYPLIGTVELDPPMALAEALAGNGAVMARVLADRLGLATGESFRLGTADYTLTAILELEPDSAAGGFSLGPRTLLRTEALEPSGLLAPGTLFDSQYRMLLPPGTDLDVLATTVEDQFRDSGMRWRDARNGTPASRFSWNGWAVFWCWSGCRVLRWAASGCPRRCGPIWPARPA